MALNPDAVLLACVYSRLVKLPETDTGVGIQVDEDTCSFR